MKELVQFDKVFLPLRDSKPCTLSIRGHNLVILAQDDRAFDGSAALWPVDKVVPIEGVDSADELCFALSSLGVSKGCSVVVAPQEVPIDDLVGSLQRDLPWMQ